MRRHLKRSDVNPIDPRYFFVISLHMSGRKVKEISELSGFAESTIYDILSRKESIQIRQQILKNTQQEFENLFEKVVDAVNDGLSDVEIGTRLNAAQIWLKAHGKYTKDEGGTINITAENVVAQILMQAKEGSA